MSGMPFDVDAHIDRIRKETERREKVKADEAERLRKECAFLAQFDQTIVRADTAFMARKWECPQFKKDLAEIAKILKERPELAMSMNRPVLNDLGFSPY